MRATTFGLAGLLLIATAPLHAQALQPPAAPVVTASADLRELIFDWERVPNAYTYWLMEKKDANSSFTRIGERIPGSRPRAAVPVAVHLQNWAQARYAVSACNMAGCTRSAEINPQALMLDTIGYFKASNTQAGDLFGGGVAMSADGSTLVVSALWEASNASGVDGNQADNSSPVSGAVYVFRRDGRRWRQEAYLKAGVNQANQSFGGYSALAESIAVSGDGSWLAVGAPMEDVAGIRDAGTVYLFHRAPDGSWTLQSSLHSPQPFPAHQFGRWIDMSTDGRILKVVGLGISDDDVYTDENAPVYLYELQDSTWQLSASLAPSYPGFNCNGARMSGDGNTLIAHCASELYFPGERLLTYKRAGNAWPLVSDLVMSDTFASQPMPLNHDATRMALLEGPNIRNLVIHRWSNNQWVRDAVLTPPGAGDGWGVHAKFNGSGTLLAISAHASTVAGAGVMPAVVPGGVPHGAAFVFERTANTQTPWKLRSVVKAPNPDRDDGFGLPLALSANGRYLAVGAWREDSNARGIDGNRGSNAAEDAGAVYLY